MIDNWTSYKTKQLSLKLIKTVIRLLSWPCSSPGSWRWWSLFPPRGNCVMSVNPMNNGSYSSPMNRNIKVKGLNAALQALYFCVSASPHLIHHYNPLTNKDLSGPHDPHTINVSGLFAFGLSSCLQSFFRHCVDHTVAFQKGVQVHALA